MLTNTYKVEQKIYNVPERIYYIFTDQDKKKITKTVGTAGVAAITAAGAVLSTGANAYATGRMNKKNRKFAEHMYNRQREHALIDWDNQNKYNSPIEQMARLKAAGLNPNLVYGDGANSPSATIRGAEAATPKTEAPQFGNIAGETISKYFEVTAQKQQIKNLEATEKLIKAQTDSTLANAGLKQIDLRTETAAEEQNVPLIDRLNKSEKLGTDTELSKSKARSALVQAEIDEITKQTSVDAAVQKLIQMRLATAKTDQEKKNLQETYRILKANGTIAELDAEFAGNMNKRWDGYILRILGTLFGGKK